ncbi:E-selectin-like isoform X6 [Mauremys reevesii]|uniref:E-selectin-like isoform X6 n=1 Tax=Mauremys reevesii TaxID=260615 RepID=UPI00193F85C5|nr:E-selectin-like isoform X6 [Mauremys reevesii]
MIGLWFLSVLTYGLMVLEEGNCWTYHYSEKNMTYKLAEEWCRKHYTNMVAIQNKEEIVHLNAFLPFNPVYYWIGIRKIDNEWTWVGTRKQLTEEAKNWAEDEPNNKKNDEDCVEIYIKRGKDEGKWNDERCSKQKVALCYAASCNQSSCSGHGECLETINNHTCLCDAGFYGPECQHVVTCDQLKEPDQGTLECSHPLQNYSYNSSCEVQCAEGYESTGFEPVWCTSSGNWSAPTPACRVVQCDGLKAPPHGSLTCSSVSGNFLWNSTCEFTCEEGFVLKGSDRLQCGASGEWNGQQPECEVVQCDGLKAPAHASVTCSPASRNFLWNSTCEFACEEGFVLKGSDRLQCGASGEWEGQQPECEVVQCDGLKAPAHGSVTCSPASGNFLWNSTCEFACEEGFVLKGSDRLQCGASGEWEGQQPECEVVQCDGLKAPAHGSVTCSPASGNFLWNSTCEFACEEGFVLKGSDRLQCGASGEWDGQQPECEVVQCDGLKAPAHGSVTCSPASGNFLWNSTCEFACEEGFVLKGSDRLQCGASGEWDGQQPECEVVQCDGLKAPAHGSVTCSPASGNFLWNSTCEFACEEGFVLKGSDRLQCGASGEWEGQQPECEVVQCDGLKAPAHGSVTCSPASGNFLWNSTCEFACEEGFVLKGSDRLQCGASGEWEGQQPECEAVMCEAVNRPENGFVECTTRHPEFTYNSACEFHCEEGYRLSGSRTIQCTAQGEWSEPFPKCEVAQCETLILPEKGSMNCSHPLGDFAYSTVCEFNCTEGWLLKGSNILQCGAAGNWTASQPTCEAPQVPEELLSYVSVGIAATGASLLSTASFLIWLVKRLRRKAKKFTPASSCQSLNSECTFQSTAHLI